MNFKAAVSKVGMTIKKHSPEILGAVGMVATIGGVIWACKATMDSAEDIKACKENLDDIQKAVDDGVIEKKEGTKRKISEFLHCAKDVGVRYAGPSALIGGGLYCQHRSRSELGKRLNTATMAYTALESRYKLLEDNVRRDYGEDELNRLKYGLGGQKGTVKRVDSEGNEYESEETINGVLDLNDVKPFTIIFDNKSRNHHTSRHHCDRELIAMEKSLTDWLRIKKVIWLDWAMEQLDIHPQSKEEAQLWHMICWTYKPGAPDADNAVKLRYRQVINPDDTQFDVDYNPVYILDPNYDTNMLQDWYQPRQ